MTNENSENFINCMPLDMGTALTIHRHAEHYKNVILAAQELALKHDGIVRFVRSGSSIKPTEIALEEQKFQARKIYLIEKLGKVGLEMLGALSMLHELTPNISIAAEVVHASTNIGVQYHVIDLTRADAHYEAEIRGDAVGGEFFVQGPEGQSDHGYYGDFTMDPAERKDAAAAIVMFMKINITKARLTRPKQ